MSMHHVLTRFILIIFIVNVMTLDSENPNQENALLKEIEELKNRITELEN